MYVATISLRRFKCRLFIIGLSLPFACYADDAGEWYARVGGLEALYHSGARIDTVAGTIPGASAKVSNSTTGIIDIGYDIAPSIFVMLMAGVPPRPRISGEGSAAALGELGAVTYGPAVATVGYRIPVRESFQPYLGAGAAYAIILRNHDAAISNLNVHNNFGFALQAGGDYALSRRLQIFADVKQLWLSVNANGSLGGVEPVAARVQLNPTLISVGIKVRVK
jgi:outer membrane protein